MLQHLSFRLVTKSEVRAGRSDVAVDDPEHIAEISEEKRAAILTNPLGPGDADAVQILALQDERVIGRMDLIRGEIRKNDESCPVYWGSALAVPAAHRASGAGLFLILQAQSLHHTVGASGVSRDAYPIYQALRWTELQMLRWILPLSTRPIFDRYTGRLIPTRPLVKVSDLALFLRNAIRRRIFGHRNGLVECQRVSRMGGELETALAVNSAPVSCHRSVEWINWLLENQFSQSPDRVNALYYIYDRLGEAIGYFLVKVHRYPLLSKYDLPDVTLGSLMDWSAFGDQPLDLPLIVALATEELMKYGVDAIEVCATDETEGQFLKKLGFVRQDYLRLMLKTSKGSGLSDRRFHRREMWRITPADGDNFFD